MDNYKVKYPDNVKPFPDDNWKKVNGISRGNVKEEYIWKWYDEKKRIAFVSYRFDSKDGLKNEVPITYQRVEEEYFEYDTNLADWNWKLPLFNLPDILENKNKKIIIFEGAKTAAAGSKLYKDYICTTFKGGASQYDNSDWEPLAKREVYLFLDNDKAGERASSNLGLKLKQLGCKVKEIRVPHDFPPKWDVADPLPENSEYNYLQLLDLAEDYSDPVYFKTLEKDAKRKRFIILEETNGKNFYDKDQRKILHKDLINLLYQADTSRKDKREPIKIIAESSPERVQSTAFVRADKDIVTIDGKKYLNTYFPVKFPKLTKAEVAQIPERIKIWKEHLLMIFNKSQKLTDYFESTLAHDLQKPNYNRTWAWLLHSSQGVGKGVIFEVVKKLNGSKNCAHVTNDMFLDKYRSYLQFTDTIICTEVRIKGRDRDLKVDKLKELISETTHPIQEKFVKQVYHEGHYKVYLSTNDPVSMNLERTDRRINYNSTLVSKREILEQNANYFVDIWAWINDEDNIKFLLNYYKHHYTIVKEFNPHEPIETVAKKNLQQASSDQIFKDLDFYKDHNYFGLGRAFDRDFINVRKLFDEIRDMENESCIANVGHKRKFGNLTETKLSEWLYSIEAKPVYFGKPKNLDNTTRKRWWIIRNTPYWEDLTDIQILREHLRGNHDAVVDLFHNKVRKEKEAI